MKKDTPEELMESKVKKKDKFLNGIIYQTPGEKIENIVKGYEVLFYIAKAKEPFSYIHVSFRHERGIRLCPAIKLWNRILKNGSFDRKLPSS